MKEGVNFLAELLDLGLGYSAINTARSALSSIMNTSDRTTFGAHPLVCRFLRGVFVERPSLPRYKTIWDVNIVLKYLKQLHIDKDLTLRDLTLKLTMLLALLSGQRCQTLHLLNLEGMNLTAQQGTFRISEPIKTTKPGSKALQLKFVAYPADKQLCVVHHLGEYLERTKPLRGDCKQLLLSFQKPNRAVSTDTISRWLKLVLKHTAGIDITMFKAHSTRAASTSAAASGNIPLSTIMASAGWSNADTFSKFYNKPVITNEQNFGEALLQSLQTTNEDTVRHWIKQFISW